MYFKSKKLKNLKESELVNLLDLVFEGLNPRETEVLKRRYRIQDGRKHTLEEIGKGYNITRERVRQIEKDALNRIQTLDLASEKLANLAELKEVINEALDFYGGLLEETHLIEELLNNLESEAEKDYVAIEFLLNSLFDQHFTAIDAPFTKKLRLSQKSKWDNYKAAINHLSDVIKTTKSPLTLDEIYSQVKDTEHYSFIDQLSGENDKNLFAMLKAHKDIDNNLLGQWGLKNWRMIVPKRMTDKIHLIFQKENKPLHFQEITDLINQANFDHKKACPATIHNELILDKRYVLIGRGIYALKDWGYEEGTVADILERIIKEAEGPLTQKELIERALDQRKVKRSTVVLALLNKNRFKKDTEGKIILI